MFQQALLTGNGLILYFPRKPDVRRDFNAIEDILRAEPGNHYKQPTVLPVPDEIDPQVPRVVFESAHGFSQIAISQVSIALNVRYSKDWQENYKLGKQYVIERSQLLFDVISKALNRKPLYAGLSSVVTLDTTATDEEILQRVFSLYQNGADSASVHDFELKVTTIVDDRFFNNILVKNYREWPILSPIFEGTRFKRRDAAKRGIQIVSDFNDRYGFNEIADYETSQETCREIVEKSFAAIQAETAKLLEVPNV